MPDSPLQVALVTAGSLAPGGTGKQIRWQGLQAALPAEVGYHPLPVGCDQWAGCLYTCAVTATRTPATTTLASDHALRNRLVRAASALVRDSYSTAALRTVLRTALAAAARITG